MTQRKDSDLPIDAPGERRIVQTEEILDSFGWHLGPKHLFWMIPALLLFVFSVVAFASSIPGSMIEKSDVVSALKDAGYEHISILDASFVFVSFRGCDGFSAIYEISAKRGREAVEFEVCVCVNDEDDNKLDLDVLFPE